MVVVTLLVSAGSVWSQEDGGLRPAEEQALTGEVVALWCLVREGSFGTGKLNNAKQVVCIQRGSPIAIKVGTRLYLVAIEDHVLKDRLTAWAGYRVTAHGHVSMRNGQPSFAVSSVQRAK
jgi:hypothetical protein